LADVSYTTVSHVINATRRVAPETADRVRAAIAELRFRPCSRARGLRTGKSGLLGVLTTRGHDLFFGEVLVGVENACREAGVGLIVSHSEGDEATELEALGMFVSKGVDAVIVNNLVGGPEAFDLIAAAGLPLVILQAVSPGPAADSIAGDDYAGAFAAAGHLAALGHRRIACLAGHALPHHTVMRRRDGYAAALRAAGIEPDPSWFVVTDYRPESAYAAVVALRGRPEPPTAFFCYSDLTAMAALRAAADLGLAVPGDVSVVGYDDIMPAAYTIPRLTTVRQPKAELGAAAVAKALERRDSPTLEPRTTALPVELVVRESTGPARPEEA
jgi:DNA-binding LacI/PurR family transcriptional regulator